MSIRSNVDARRLDQRIEIHRADMTQDSTGDLVPNWRTLIECAAAVDARPSSAEPVILDGIRSVGAYTFWIRADIYTRFSLVLTDRVKWKGKFFDIKDMPDQQLRGRLIALIAETGKNEG